MKLWKKLSLMTGVVLLTVTGLTGAGMLGHSARYNEAKLLENYEQQAHSTALALGRELDEDRIRDYSDTTRHAYLNYVMKKYGAEQYILLQQEEILCNLTPFLLTDTGTARWNRQTVESLIQKNGPQYVLVAGRAVPTESGGTYRLVLVKDVSAYFAEQRQQAVFFALLYLTGTGAAILLTFFFTGKMLAPLQELQHAAEDIRTGQLSRRACVRSRDEVGALASAFNAMAEKLEQQVAALLEVSGQQRQMLGSLAHEMKTPMTSIIGYADSLLHVRLKEEQRQRALVHIYEESYRLERLSGKLMSLVGLYENDSIHLEKTDVSALLSRVQELERYPLAQKHITLTVSCEMGERLLDADLFESLLINLIDNAAKASAPGSEIRLSAAGDVITVRDFGCGIPAEEIARVTEAFYMVDKARSRQNGGSGLGLALCERIAQVHGARLEIASRAGEGTAVSVVFAECLQPAADFLRRAEVK